MYVRTADGERSVGQVPDVSPEQAMAFFTRRFENLQVEVQLLESRIDSGTVPPDEARKSIKSLTESVTTANAVGDLAGLVARISALEPKVAAAAEQRREAKLAAHGTSAGAQGRDGC